MAIKFFNLLRFFCGNKVFASSLSFCGNLIFGSSLSFFVAIKFLDLLWVFFCGNHVFGSCSTDNQNELRLSQQRICTDCCLQNKMLKLFFFRFLLFQNFFLIFLECCCLQNKMPQISTLSYLTTAPLFFLLLESLAGKIAWMFSKVLYV